MRTGRAIVPLLLVLFVPYYRGRDQQNAWWHLVVVGVIALGGVVSWLVTRWRVEDGSLRVESGLLRRDSQRMPLARVQAVDIVRPGLARLLGLAEVRLRTAGETGDAGRLAYLRLAEAERVRAQLLAIAHGVHADAPPPPEWPLYLQRGDRLAVSVMLSRPFGILALFGVAIAVTEFISPTLAGSIIGFSFAYVLAIATVVWRRFNAGFGLRVGEAADGLRLRAGALETRAETIPRGRVQAVVRTEPLFWRPTGWVRQQIDVAGQAKGREERQAGTRQLREVVPAGTPADAIGCSSGCFPAPGRPLAATRPGPLEGPAALPLAGLRLERGGARGHQRPGYQSGPSGSRWPRCRACACGRARSSAGWG